MSAKSFSSPSAPFCRERGRQSTPEEAPEKENGMKHIRMVFVLTAMTLVFFAAGSVRAQDDELGKIHILNYGAVPIGDGVVEVEFLVDFQNFTEGDPVRNVQITTNHGAFKVPGEFSFHGEVIGYGKLMIHSFDVDQIVITKATGTIAGKRIDLKKYIDFDREPTVPIPMRLGQ
jgi:hypothetical protein